MEMILTLVVLIGGPLLWGARSRIGRLERRLIELERATSRGTAAPAMPLRDAEPPRAAEPSPVVPAPVIDPTPIETAAPAMADIAPPPAPAAIEETVLAAAPPSPEPNVAEPIPPAPPRPPRRAINFEELFGRKLPIWAGGITLAIAGVLIVNYAIEAGFFARIFTPGVQVVCGILFGLGLIGGAEWAHARRDRVDDPRVGQALSGAGIATLYAAVLVAANIYGLIAPLTAFIGLAAVTAGAMALALRHGAPTALLGLAGGLAAPALTVGLSANVPLLAVYLALTIAGLAGVSRARRWPWLALLALLGGAGWSLWMILAGDALAGVGALSVGGFVMLLALAIPMLTVDGAKSGLIRAASAVVGAAQLALLVALGGFDLLHWGLFGLIAVAGQWLAWRDEAFAPVPTVSAALSFLLMMLWGVATPGAMAGVGLALVAIHAGPLLARLWRDPPRARRAIELSGIAVAMPIVSFFYYHTGWQLADHVAAAWAVGGAALAALGAGLGWKVADRAGDSRFGWLIGTTAGLLVTAAILWAQPWQMPLLAAAVAAIVVWLAKPAGDPRIETIGTAFGGVALVLLVATTGSRPAEWNALIDGRAAGTDGLSLLRWGGLTALFAWIAVRSIRKRHCLPAFVLAGGLAYGVAAQVVPVLVLPLVAAAGCLALAIWSQRRTGTGTGTGLGLSTLSLGVIAGAWAAVPLGEWLLRASASLSGLPMMLDSAELTASSVARRLLGPALLVGGALWTVRQRLPRPVALIGAVMIALPGIAAVHVFYRAGFAALFGTDFVTTGLAQRLVWSGLLIVAGVALSRKAGGMAKTIAAPVLVGCAAIHTLAYSLLLHDPLWSAQAVGAVPLANLLAPLFVAVPLCLWLLARMVPRHALGIDRAFQGSAMIAIALFAWATLRQVFHGTLLVDPGTGQAEDILRSILGIGLAIGFLLWGIRRHRRDWRLASLVLMVAAVAKVFLFDASGLEGLLRIASFVALGFSLIGIGWLYSRQLRAEAA